MCGTHRVGRFSSFQRRPGQFWGVLYVTFQILQAATLLCPGIDSPKHVMFYILICLFQFCFVFGGGKVSEKHIIIIIIIIIMYIQHVYTHYCNLSSQKLCIQAQARILVLGLDNAGKTTILKKPGGYEPFTFP